MEAGSGIQDAPLGIKIATLDQEGHYQITTGGVVVQADQCFYQMTTKHTPEPIRSRSDQINYSDLDECHFDWQSDEEEDEEDWEAPTEGSLTPTSSPPAWVDDHLSESDDSLYSNQSAHSTDLTPTHSLYEHRGELEEPRIYGNIHVVSSGLEPILQDRGLNSQLDYILLPLYGDPKAANEVNLRDPTRPAILHVPFGAEIPSRECRILAVTGSSGVVYETLIPGPTYVRGANSAAIQEIYSVQLQGAVVEGDCGSAVLDAKTCAFYGHIVRGCPYTVTAYILSPADIFQELDEKFGAGAVVFPAPPPINGKVLDDIYKMAREERQYNSHSVFGRPDIATLFDNTNAHSTFSDAQSGQAPSDYHVRYNIP